jgi:DNA-binding PadR family transcriptional regulator
MSEVLSKTALLILGIIACEPTNPYAISKLVNWKRRNIRIKIPTQTVYGIINKFKKRGVVSGKKVKNGNMPDMTIYSITPKGEKLIKKNLIDYLTNPQEVLTELLLSIILIGYLDKETALKTLKEHQVKNEEAIAVGKALRKSKKQTDESHIREISIEYILYTLQVNRKTVDTLMKTVETEPRWADSLIPWWRDEFPSDKKTRKKTQRIKSLPELQ